MQKPNPAKNLSSPPSTLPWNSSWLPYPPSSPGPTNSRPNPPPGPAMAASKNPSWRSRKLLPSRCHSKKQEAASKPLATAPAPLPKSQESTRGLVLRFAASPG